MKEEWLMAGVVVPVDVETTAALVAEIRRLIDVVGGMALAQAQQKPVAWGVFDGLNLHDMFYAEEDAKDMARLKGDGSVVKPLIIPPAAQRKPLTDEQLNEIADRNYSHWVEFARAIEVAHGIKENT